MDRSVDQTVDQSVDRSVDQTVEVQQVRDQVLGSGYIRLFFFLVQIDIVGCPGNQCRVGFCDCAIFSHFLSQLLTPNMIFPVPSLRSYCHFLSSTYISCDFWTVLIRAV